MEFISKMNNISDRNFNPFKSVIVRLKLFVKQNKLSEESLLKKLAAREGVHSTRITPEAFGNFLNEKVDKKRSKSEL